MVFNDLLVVTPHSGILIPPEIAIDTLSDEFEKFTVDIDWHTHWLYDFRDILDNSQMIFPYCSLILEANRNPDILEDSVPLKNRLAKDLYKKGEEPDITLKQLLARKYLKPFHYDISKKIVKYKINFMLDGHSTVTSHGVADNQIELMNYQVSPIDSTKTIFSPDAFIEIYAEELAKMLPEIKISVNESEFDTVYGHVCGQHSTNSMKRKGARVPAILQETNQKLYMNRDMTPDIFAIETLRRVFAESLSTMITKVNNY
ncbi:MAG: N-formylglutamate amidohydrolase [Dehalococcoidales bacterium]|nr:N-formylglutamate amidohydrolase [Dehalococcoidales bacterium]